MKKRIISLLLSAVMLFSLLPVTAFAEEPAGRGESWDILYSEVRENGSGKAYPVGTRIYMDIKPLWNGEELDEMLMDSYDCAVELEYIEGTVDPKYKNHYYAGPMDLNSVFT